MSELILRPYQQQAVDETMGEIAFGSENIVLVASVSYGKSAYISAVAKELKDMGGVAIIVNITVLIDQIAEHLNEMGIDYSILKAGYEDKFDPGKRIQLIMSQTLHARLDNIKLNCKFAIIDERHREYETQRTTDVLNHIGADTVIGCTATPWTQENYMLPHLDAVVETISVKELEEKGFIAPVKYYIPKWAQEVDYSQISKSGDYSDNDIASITLSEEYRTNAIDAMMYMEIDKKKSIVFCSNIKHCEAVAEDLRVKGVLAYPFHSKQDKKHSEAILESFRTNKVIKLESNLLGSKEIECKVLVSVSKAAIGFSVTDIELGVDTRKTKIRSNYIQRIGRIKRAHPGKQYAQWLDLAGNVAEHGFEYESYRPPEPGDKETLRKVQDEKRIDVMHMIVSEEPTEVNQKLVLKAIEEINKAKERGITEMSIKEMLAIYEMSRDPKEIILIGFEMNRRKYGIPYKTSTVEWAAEPWYDMIKEFDMYQSRILRSLKTMLRNKIQKGAKPAGIKYSASWLSEQEPYSLVNKIQEEVQEERYDDYDYVDIDMDDIPFGYIGLSEGRYYQFLI